VEDDVVRDEARTAAQELSVQLETYRQRVDDGFSTMGEGIRFAQDLRSLTEQIKGTFLVDRYEYRLDAKALPGYGTVPAYRRAADIVEAALNCAIKRADTIMGTDKSNEVPEHALAAVECLQVALQDVIKFLEPPAKNQ
jgi:hypothetical protein